MKRVFLRLISVFAAALALAGCGGADDFGDTKPASPEVATLAGKYATSYAGLDYDVEETLVIEENGAYTIKSTETSVDNPQDVYVITAGGTITAWNPATGKATINVDGETYTTRFILDGDMLTNDDDGNVTVYVRQ